MQRIASRSGCTSVALQVTMAAVLTAQKQHKANLLESDKKTRKFKIIKLVAGSFSQHTQWCIPCSWPAEQSSVTKTGVFQQIP